MFSVSRSRPQLLLRLRLLELEVNLKEASSENLVISAGEMARL